MLYAFLRGLSAYFKHLAFAGGGGGGDAGFWPDEIIDSLLIVYLLILYVVNIQGTSL